MIRIRDLNHQKNRNLAFFCEIIHTFFTR